MHEQRGLARVFSDTGAVALYRKDIDGTDAFCHKLSRAEKIYFPAKVLICFKVGVLSFGHKRNVRI